MKKAVMVAIIIIALLTGCKQGINMVEMPTAVQDMTFSEYPGHVSPADLGSFTGTAITPGEIDDLTQATSPMSIAMPKLINVLNVHLSRNDSKSVSWFAAFGFSLSNESFPFEGGSLTVNEFSGFISQATETGSIGDEIADYMSGALSGIDNIRTNTTTQLVVDVDLNVTDQLINEFDPIIDGSWHHLSDIQIDTSDITFSYDDTTGENNATGAISISAALNSSFGFTISGMTDSNGKYIVSIVMTPISITVNSEDIISASEEEDFYTSLSQLLTGNAAAEDLFEITFSVYDNNNSLIDSRSFSLVEATDILNNSI